MKGRLYSTCPMLKAISSENVLVPSKTGPKMAGFEVKRGVQPTFYFATPKGTSLRETASFDVFCVKIRASVLAVDDLKNPKITNK